MAARITAVVPCYEAGDLLLRAIDSLRRQTLPPVEIIVVDDGSLGADTVRALERADAVPTVRVIRLEHNDGVANARNVALDEAQGDHAVFLDADDLFTAPSLEAFAAALARSHGTDFTYPTVTCFGNRTNTFPPPPFNAYLLHHINICPISAMVTRRAIDSGVRFDPSIDVGHEDWDYWLRLTADGFLGVAAPDATLLYRRIGFTRMDLGNQIAGGFDTVLRNLRPEVFDPQRLARIKQVWAPALSLLDDRGAALLDGQTCIDAEVVSPTHADEARGRYVVVGDMDPDGDPTLVEDVLSLADGVQPPRWVVTLRTHAARMGTSSAPLRTTDLRDGWVRDEDIRSVACRRGEAITGPTGEVDTERLLSDLRVASVRAPQEILWRAPCGFTRRRTEATDPAPTNAERAEGWAQEALDTLPTATPWRVAGTGGGLFRDPPASTTVALLWVDDENGGRSLYAFDEGLPAGSRVVSRGPELMSAATAGAEALLRCLDHRTGRRLIATEPLPQGVTAEAVVGYVPLDLLPGAAPLVAHDAMGQRLLGANIEVSAPDEVLGDHLLRPIIGGRRLWRLHDIASRRHFYGFSPASFSAFGQPPDGPLGVLLAQPAADDDCHPLRLLLDADGRFAGLARASGAPDGLRLGPVGAWLYTHPAAGRTEMTTAWNGARSSMIIRTIPNEGGDEGFVQYEHLGYAPS